MSGSKIKRSKAATFVSYFKKELSKSENENRPYIVATGAVSACCWVEGSEDERQMYLLAGQDHDDHNINDRLLSDILTEEPYVSMFAKAWASQSNPVCIRKCGHMRRSRRRML